MGGSSIQVQASIAGPLEKIWIFWTSPDHITKWNFAVPEWCCPSAANDLKVGGKYVARMEARDGSFGFDFEAVYDEVVTQKRLAYTLSDGRKVVTTFEPTGSGTLVTTVFEAETQNPIDLQKNGWQSILNNFKAYAETN